MVKKTHAPRYNTFLKFFSLCLLFIIGHKKIVTAMSLDREDTLRATQNQTANSSSTTNIIIDDERLLTPITALESDSIVEVYMLLPTIDKNSIEADEFESQTDMLMIESNTDATVEKFPPTVKEALDQNLSEKNEKQKNAKDSVVELASQSNRDDDDMHKTSIMKKNGETETKSGEEIYDIETFKSNEEKQGVLIDSKMTSKYTLNQRNIINENVISAGNIIEKELNNNGLVLETKSIDTITSTLPKAISLNISENEKSITLKDLKIKEIMGHTLHKNFSTEHNTGINTREIIKTHKNNETNKVQLVKSGYQEKENETIVSDSKYGTLNKTSSSIAEKKIDKFLYDNSSFIENPAHEQITEGHIVKKLENQVLENYESAQTKFVSVSSSTSPVQMQSITKRKDEQPTVIITDNNLNFISETVESIVGIKNIDKSNSAESLNENSKPQQICDNNKESDFEKYLDDSLDRQLQKKPINIEKFMENGTYQDQFVDVMDSIFNYVNASFANNKNRELEEEANFKPLIRSYEGAQVWRIVVQNGNDRQLADELRTKYGNL